jgi:hypothetical protein
VAEVPRAPAALSTSALVVGLVLVVLGLDEASAGALRGPVALGLPVGVATWTGGRNAGLNTAVLATIVVIVLESARATGVLWWARALDLAVLSVVVGTVSAVSDHFRASWPRALLETTVLDERGMSRRLELELDRLRTRSTSLAVCAVDVETEPADPRILVLLEAITRSVRGLDAVSGDAERFWLLLPDTDGAGARLALERHRATLVGEALRIGLDVRIHAGATIVRSPARGWEVILRAKAAQDLARKIGRDQIVVVDPRLRRDPC